MMPVICRRGFKWLMQHPHCGDVLFPCVSLTLPLRSLLCLAAGTQQLFSLTVFHSSYLLRRPPAPLSPCRLSDEQEAESRRFATMKGAKKQFCEWQAGLMQGHSEVKFGKRKDRAPPRRLHDHLSQTSSEPAKERRERDATQLVSALGRGSPLPPVRDPRSPSRNSDAAGAVNGGIAAEARAWARARDGKEGARAAFVASGSQGRLGEEDSSSKQLGGRLVAAMNRPLHTIWKPVRGRTWTHPRRNSKHPC
jgi:hypothetical protein